MPSTAAARPHRTRLSPELQKDLQRLKRSVPWLLVLVLIGLVLWLSYFATGLLIGRQREWTVLSKPERLGLTPKTVSFRTRDGLTLRAWWERSRTISHPKGTVILVHGMNMNKVGMAFQAARLLADGYNILMPDLRARGESAGWYTTCGYMEAQDVLAAIHWAERQDEHGPISLLGYSSGAVAALYAAAESPQVAAVAADSAFVSVSDVLDRESGYLANEKGRGVAFMHKLRVWAFTAPGMHGLTRWMFRMRSGVPLEPAGQNVLDAVARIKHAPVLYLRSQGDPVVPAEVTRQLYDRTATPQKEMVVLRGKSHSALFGDRKRYLETVEQFLDRASGAPAVAVLQ